MKREEKKRSSKLVYWICDKQGCNTDNTREIPAGTVLYEDYCDVCEMYIHEPITIDVK